MKTTELLTVYVSIGNSDDKLTQREWADFQCSIDALMHTVYVRTIHGRWASLPDAPYQNACCCADVYAGEPSLTLRRALAKAAGRYRQDSVAWAEATTTFVEAS